MNLQLSSIFLIRLLMPLIASCCISADRVIRVCGSVITVLKGYKSTYMKLQNIYLDKNVWKSGDMKDSVGVYSADVLQKFDVFQF